MKRTQRAWIGRAGIAAAIGLLVAGLLWFEIVWMYPVRASVQNFSQLIQAANTQDVARARRLCSRHYLSTHALKPAREGGIVGLPRNIHKNFQAWRHGGNVWLCPTNRVGPLYQFVLEEGAWKFDGPIGLLRSRGEIILSPDLVEPNEG